MFRWVDVGKYPRDHSLTIDYEGHAFGVAPLSRHAILTCYYALGIGEQRKLDVVLLGKLLVGVEGVQRNTKNLRTQCFELREPVAEGFRLGNSTRGFVLGVEVEDDWTPDKGGHLDARTVVRHGFDVRSSGSRG